MYPALFKLIISIGIIINWTSIPGHATINAPDKNALKVKTLVLSINPIIKRTKPHPSLPKS